MKRLLKIAVKDMFGGANMPACNNRRFYPSIGIIRAHIVIEQRKLKHSLIDQECLMEKIEDWKKADASVNIFFRPKCVDTNDNENSDLRDLLFVYQAKWQQNLLERYGSEMLLLDATYKTTRYALPLFFLTVKTNVDYQIIATFVIESETTEAIKEALGVIASWNPSFKPRYCMTDYCNEEINALEATFPGQSQNLNYFWKEWNDCVNRSGRDISIEIGYKQFKYYLFLDCHVFICDFHREQAWERWLVKKTNGCSGRKGDILPKLRMIARSNTEDEMELAIEAFCESDFWCDIEYPKLKDYLTKYWFNINKVITSATLREQSINSSDGVVVILQPEFRGSDAAFIYGMVAQSTLAKME